MSDVFRSEAVAARREQAGPGRLLGRERLGRLWLAMVAIVAAGLVLSVAIRVPVFAVGSARVDARTGRVDGAVFGRVQASSFRVTPAGECGSADLAGGVRPAGGLTFVSGRLPRRCRGTGGTSRVSLPNGDETLAQLVWEQFR